jgi:hypothetical protein
LSIVEWESTPIILAIRDNDWCIVVFDHC